MIGNIVASFLYLSRLQNVIGEYEETEAVLYDKKGFLDDLSNDSSFNLNAKLKNSSHVFITDYFDISNLDFRNLKLRINDKDYEVNYIDNPMNLNRHIEIYLRRISDV